MDYLQIKSNVQGKSNNMKTEKKGRKGYKASNDGVCRNITYEVGHTYRKHSKPIMCKFGYHYCENPDDVFEYYDYRKGVTKIFEIEDLGATCRGYDKCVTNKIKIVREIPFEEWSQLMTRILFDSNRNQIQTIKRSGSWVKHHYDSQDRLILCEDEKGYWRGWKYSENGDIRRNGFGFGKTEYENWKNGI